MNIFSLLDVKYNEFSNKVKNYLSKTLSGHSINYGSNTIFGQILTVIGSATQNIMLYIEDALTEQNKYTAQRKKSIYGLAALSGYEPSRGKAAVATLKLDFMPNNEGAYNIVLNNKEQLTCTQNGLTYSLLLPQEVMVLSIEQNNKTRHFTVVQGEFEKQTFVSKGGRYYTINFKFSGNLDTDYLNVRVNNELWEKQASLYDMNPDAKEYTFKSALNGGIDIIFGNDTHGRSLNANDVVTIEYLIHDGAEGNLNPALETYFVFNNTLKDINGEQYDGNTLFNIVFAESDPVTAGSNSESTLHVKEMIGLNSRSLVLSSPDNYKVLINRFGFCGYNRTWSDPNSMVVNSLIIKNFKSNISSGNDYFNLKESDFVLSDVQKKSIYDYISSSGNQLATIKYNIFDPEICKYALYLYIKITDGKYNKTIISNNIRYVIGEFFSNVTSDIFIPKSDIIHLIKSNVEGVDSVDIYILSQKNEEAMDKLSYEDVSYKFNSITGQYIKTVEKVKLYAGENPNLGLDEHGNIYLTSNTQFPVIMGGWSYWNDEKQQVQVVDPVTIIFEE